MIKKQLHSDPKQEKIPGFIEIHEESSLTVRTPKIYAFQACCADMKRLVVLARNDFFGISIENHTLHKVDNFREIFPKS